jgi:cytidylate kinase
MYNIAIDGPSGAGKSTIAKALAEKLNILYLDTGAMYRAVGLKCIENNVLPEDAEAVLKLLKNTDIQVLHSADGQRIVLDGRDVSGEIRMHEVSSYASRVSAIPEVRIRLVEMQREIAKKQPTVLDGRDIGTYVLPNAEVKIFLTASSHIRAERRTRELIKKGQTADFETIKADIEKRDHDDSTRKFAPLLQADDAELVDTSEMTIAEATKVIFDIVNKKIGT